MKNDDQLSKEIEATLNSLDGVSRAETAPYFYTRLEAKLETRRVGSPSLLYRLLTRPAVAVSILTIFLVLNIMAIKGLTNDNTSAATKTASLQSFATEYNLNTTSVYNNSGK